MVNCEIHPDKELSKNNICKKCYQKDYLKKYYRINKQKLDERHKEYEFNNLERVREIKRNYRERNPNKDRDYYKTHKESVDKRNKKWRDNNKDYYKKYNKKYRKEHPEKKLKSDKKSLENY